MSKDLRIIFIGTPDFAVESLSKLIEAGKNIVAVITAPDRPAGRGLSLQQSAVKQFAVKHALPLLQPTNLKSPVFIAELQAYQADLQVVIAFRMLPEMVWNMPALGTMNLHASLLPNYRGAAPINWAIINGENETGVSTFLLKHQIDTGDILLQEKVDIEAEDNAGTLHDKLMQVGAELVLKSIYLIEDGNYNTTPQIHTFETKHAPKIFKETCEIDWQKDARTIENLVRGLSPYPVARCIWQNKILKIFTCKPLYTSTLKSSEFSTDYKTFLHVGTSDFDMELTDIQLEGKKRMKIDELLRGIQQP